MNSAGGLELRLSGVAKSFEEGRITALRGLDLVIGAGEFVAVTGPSGCGKSTLLNLIGGLDAPDEGTIEADGAVLGTTDLTSYRSREVGFVFQLHNLIPVLTALENVQVPMLGVGGPPAGERHDRAMRLLAEVGLSERAGARPPQLSGGERQRVAVARALANDPRLLLADEPTGSLDQETGTRVLDLLARAHEERGATLVLVTHEDRIAARARRTIALLDGRLAPTPSRAN